MLLRFPFPLRVKGRTAMTSRARVEKRHGSRNMTIGRSRRCHRHDWRPAESSRILARSLDFEVAAEFPVAIGPSCVSSLPFVTSAYSYLTYRFTVHLFDPVNSSLLLPEFVKLARTWTGFFSNPYRLAWLFKSRCLHSLAGVNLKCVDCAARSKHAKDN